MKAQNAPSARTHRSRTRRKQPFIDRYRGAIVALAGAVLVGGLLTIAILETTGGSSDAPASAPSQNLDPVVAERLTSVSGSIFDSVGAGSATNPPRAIDGAATTVDGKPEILYVGAEFCPFCAAERWPLLLALSRFGSFSGLKESSSAADDVYPSTPTVSFYGSTYDSDYLTFTAVETATNQRTGNGYAPLQSLTSEQQSILNRYNNGGGIPFVYVGGEYVIGGANFSPALLAGMDLAGIATAIENTDSAQSKAIVGSANVLTAAICQLTGSQPGEVCQAPGVMAASSQLK